MNRKQFIKTAIGGGISLSLTPNLIFAKNSAALKNNGLKKLTILHTNDQHSRIEPFDSSYTKTLTKGALHGERH